MNTLHDLIKAIKAGVREARYVFARNRRARRFTKYTEF